jgi:hypothetical protein
MRRHIPEHLEATTAIRVPSGQQGRSEGDLHATKAAVARCTSVHLPSSNAAQR